MLVDTSGFLCRYEKRERFHEKAVEIYDSATIRLTTNYVLAEYTALAAVRGIPREQIIQFSEDIFGDEKIEIVWVDDISIAKPSDFFVSEKIRRTPFAMRFRLF